MEFYASRPVATPSVKKITLGGKYIKNLLRPIGDVGLSWPPVPHLTVATNRNLGLPMETITNRLREVPGSTNERLVVSVSLEDILILGRKKTGKVSFALGIDPAKNKELTEELEYYCKFNYRGEQLTPHITVLRGNGIDTDNNDTINRITEALRTLYTQRNLGFVALNPVRTYIR